LDEIIFLAIIMNLDLEDFTPDLVHSPGSQQLPLPLSPPSDQFRHTRWAISRIEGRNAARDRSKATR
jgi:hypothetical protein